MVVRPYTRIEEVLAPILDSGETIMEVDSLHWMTEKMACDSIRRWLKRNGYEDIAVLRRGERVFVVNLKGKVKA